MKPFDQDTNNNRYITKKEVAALFQVTIRTIDAWMARGLLPYFKIGGKAVRFKQTDIEAYVGEYFRVARRSGGRSL